MGLMDNLTKKRIQSIIKIKTGRELQVNKCAPVMILNDGMNTLSKHGGDGWFALTNEGAFFVDNYLALDLEPVTQIKEVGSLLYLKVNNDIELCIRPKHDTAKAAVLETKISN